MAGRCPSCCRKYSPAYYGHRLPAAGAVSQLCHLAGRSRHRCRPRGLARCAGRVRHPHPGGPPARVGLGRRGVESFRVSEETTRALGELARSHHTTVNTVLQAGWAQLLMRLTGQHDVVFGTVVSGRPAEMAGADSMVGLLINTVPVRANITAATTTADLLDQLQSAHNDTLEHQHLALSEMHRVTGHDQLFDTVVRLRELPGRQRRVVGTATDWPSPSSPAANTPTTRLTVQAVPGQQLALRVEYDTDVFDAASVEALVGRLRRVLVAMTADPARRLSSIDLLAAVEHDRLEGWGNRAALTRPAPRLCRFRCCSPRKWRVPRGGGADVPGRFVVLPRVG